MSRLTAVVLTGVVVLGACTESPQAPIDPGAPDLMIAGVAVVRVVNANPVGAGSFHWAVDRANNNPAIGRIVFAERVGRIEMTRRVAFRGNQSLEVVGSGATLDAQKLEPGSTAFRVSGGGDLTIRGLTVENAPNEGIAVDIPAGSTGTKRVVLMDVMIRGNGGHGVVVNDQVDPDDTANSNGSDASLDVTVIRTRFLANGFGAIDKDGLRLNEGGLGDLTVTIADSRADDNGADGIEFDERGTGDVRFEVTGSHVTRNGSFDQTLADLDDGFDVDEADDGGLYGTVINSTANDNKEEGFDFNENHAGDMVVTLADAEASRNLEEGIDLEEDDDFQGGGDLVVTATRVRADGNGPGGDGGLKIRERGDGNVDATIDDSRTDQNTTSGLNIREQGNGNLAAKVTGHVAIGNGNGLAFREDDDGSQSVEITGSKATNNTSHGIDFDENSTGDLTATVDGTQSSDNGGVGVRADQGGAGVGSLTLTAMTLGNNGLGDVVANAGVVVSQLP